MNAHGLTPPADPLPRVPRRRPKSRRRWGRWWRRRLDALSTWTLVVLVALSLFLGVLLWLVTPPLPAPLLTAAGAPYVIGDSLGAASVQALLQPARVLLLYPGGPDIALGDPAANPLFGSVWTAVQSLLGKVTPADLAAARPVSREAVAAFLTARGAPQAVEVDLGPSLGWGAWWEVVGHGQPWKGAPGPSFQRVLVAWTRHATEVFLLSDLTGLRLALPAAAGRPLAQLLASQQGQPQPASYTVTPLALVATTSFPVEPGIYVPSDPTWGPAALGTEAVDGARLAAATLGDPLAVRMSHGADGVVTYSNPGDWTLEVAPDGRASLTAPEESTPSTTDWLAGLYVAARYVGRAGGWPPSAWLASVTMVYPSGGCTLATCTPSAYGYGFETRYEGLPVVGQSPAVSLTVTGSGIAAYARDVPLPGRALEPPAVTVRWLSARQVLTSLEQNPPPALYAPPMVIADITPVWVPLPLAGVLEPGWAVRFVPIAGGPARLVLVDALRGQVLAVLTEDGGG